ncbi:hypothetical protein S40285_01332 [Stachybotrys chlorohalonatus IBT 40285]|uniref:Letm1 RBD domain-containing protein n=1 Tax=Stachybotrys chlorohalonatus (strain IBT 40285) TaxID=1283841 RepID=A0A084QR10_STAC4|nr:hypothetical protein S40285_01332 [Stachybotrys chlorohalonata IBT 40285]
MRSVYPMKYCTCGQYQRLGLRLSSPSTRVRRVPAISHPAQRRLVHDAPSGDKTPTNTVLNPPASTRPPPLVLPLRSAYEYAPQYYFQLGKSYLRFYKDGLKSVWANHKLLKEKLQRTPPDDRPSVFRPHKVPRSFSRADWVLFWRVRHDLLRLPLFGLMLIVIGEFTALVVLYVDGVVPYTCRIPRQIFKALERAEQRRKTAFEELEARYPHGVLSPQITQAVGRKHVLRSLDLPGTMWDRIGFYPPGMWHIKGNLRMAFLEGDDKNILEDGGPLGMEYEEVRTACAERGVDILGKSETELRSLLGDWLRLTAAEDITERRRRMAVLLLTRTTHWPQNRDFAVPEWVL